MNDTIGTATPAAHQPEQGPHSMVIDGVPQTFHVHGRGPICVVHPGGPGADWSYIRMLALEQQATVVYVEPIGTGTSGRLGNPGDYTLDRYAHHLYKIVEHLDRGPVHVLGHSHGGYVALTMAVQHRDAVAGLVLLNSAGRAGEEWLNEMMAGVQRFAARHGHRPDIGDILAALEEEATAATEDELTALFRREFPLFFADYWAREHEFQAIRESARRYAGPNVSFPETVATYDLRAHLADLDVPTLVIAGRHDAFTASRFSEELHQLLPTSELLFLERSGHFSPLEEPQVIADAVSRFLTNSSGAVTPVPGDVDPVPLHT